MKRIPHSRILIFLITVLFCASVHVFSSNKPGNSFTQQKNNQGFIENKGQIIDQNNKFNPAVLYLLNTPGLNVQLRRGGFSYDLYRPQKIVHSSRSTAKNKEYQTSNIEHPAPCIQFHRIDFDLIGYNSTYTIETGGESSDYINYYTTGTPVDGITSLRSYSTLTYKNIYPGIDLQFIAEDSKPFEYNFILRPGADINLIHIKVKGPDKIKRYHEGIRCETILGEMDETLPVCYYNLNNFRVSVNGRFKKIAEHLYGFEVDQAIPAGSFLLIDPIPTRRWGTYYYGWMTEQGSNCTTDANNNVYITGGTSDLIHIATAGAFQPIMAGVQDVFIAKFNTNGQRVWGTYYGGSSGEVGYSCVYDKHGSIFIAGETGSPTGMATPGAHQTSLLGSTDGFLAKFDTNGQRVWSTYYGGHEVSPPGDDNLFDCSTDTSGNVYCAGETSAPDGISTSGASQHNFGGYLDNYLVRFNSDGQLVWGTYYGGTAQELNPKITVSKSGFVFTSGNTSSPNNIATPGSFIPIYPGSGSGYLACFTLSGQRLWGTYFGDTAVGSGADVMGCTADFSGNNVYIYGLASFNQTIGTPGTYEPYSPFGGGYINKFSYDGSRIWGTFFGCAYYVSAAVNDSDYLFIEGRSCNTNNDTLIPSPDAYQSHIAGGEDLVLGKFSKTGQRIWGTYYGGTNWDWGGGCAVDHLDNVYLSGSTPSVNNSSTKGFCTRDRQHNIIASPDGLYTELQDVSDAFLVKFADCWSPDTAALITGPLELCQNTNGFLFSIDPIPTAESYTWCVTGDLTIAAGQNTTSVTINAGSSLGLDTISVYATNTCGIGFPKIITRKVYQRPIPVISGNDTTCAGITNLFTTSGGKSNYQWTTSTSGTIISGGTLTDSTCSVSWSTAGAHWVRVGYTDTLGCVPVNPTQFNVWVNPGLLASIGISPSTNPVCEGSSVTFTAIPSNEGNSPTYLWKVNGINAGTNNPFYSFVPINGDIVTCQLTSSLTGCLSGNPATSNSIVMTVNPNLAVSITITAAPLTVCAGSTITFTAHPVNEGLTPSYQWKVNGVNVGTNSLNYSYIPINGDLVSCTLTSSEACTLINPVSSSQYPVTVSPVLPVSITISTPTNPFCLGSPVTFTGVPVNGAPTATFQWVVNGTNVGTNSNTFTCNPVNGDLVNCVYNSTASCLTGNPATSNTIVMIQNNSLQASVSISTTSNPFCPGTSVTFTANPTNGGVPSYQWKVNGSNVGINSNTYTYNPINNDSIRVIMTSNLACVTSSPCSSTKIIMSGTLAPTVTFTPCFDTITTINAKPIKLKGGIPLGGIYSGPGVNSGTGYFIPAAAGVGTKTITYSYTNSLPCTATKTISILDLPSSILLCGNNLTDPRDNHVYPTVQIGPQCWLSTNLNYGMILSSSQDQRDNCIAEKYCYNDSPINCTNHGGLYQWDELMLFDATPAAQGFCPPGWHIPSENDWSILFATFINSGFAGSPLKYSGFSGFNALLSGTRLMNEGWDFFGFATFFWSSTLQSDSKAWAHGMNEVDPSVSAYPSSKSNAFSVRCLKD
jgi:uncharacterized protein (TIGR02145 family)